MNGQDKHLRRASASAQSLAEAIRLLAERDRRSLGAHPKIEELAAYHAGELEPQAEARMREHIAVCRECSDLLLDLINFADLTPPPGEPDLTDDEMEQDWQALRARMGEGKTEEPARPAEVMPIRPAPTAAAPDLGRTYSPVLPIAASLLAVLGFSFGLYQSVQVTRLKQPYVGDVANALEDGQERGGTEIDVKDLARMSSERGGVVFVYPNDTGIRGYQIEILHDGEVQWKTTGAAQEGQSLAEIPVIIPGGFLEPGSYTLRLLNGAGELDHTAPLEVDD